MISWGLEADITLLSWWAMFMGPMIDSIIKPLDVGIPVLHTTFEVRAFELQRWTNALPKHRLSNFIILFLCLLVACCKEIKGWTVSCVNVEMYLQRNLKTGLNIKAQRSSLANVVTFTKMVLSFCMREKNEKWKIKIGIGTNYEHIGTKVGSHV